MDTRRGDILETDEELEKMLKKPVKRLSKKTQTIINDVAKIEDYVGEELTSTEEVEQAIETIIAREEKKPSMKRQKVLAEQELQQRQEWDAANRAIAPDLVHGGPAVEEFLANHEPGQPFPEDQAERAASGSGWQGEEIPDGELEQQVKEAKAAYRKSRGLTIDSARASEIAAEKGLDENGKKAKSETVKPTRKQKVKAVVLDGNLEVVTDKQMAKTLVRAEKRAKEKAAKPVSDHKNQSFVGKSGANYKPTSEWKKPVKVTQEKVDTMLRMKTEGATNPEIATATGAHDGMVGWVLAGKGHRDKSHLPAFQKGEAQAYWKERQAEYQARKA